MIGLEVKRSQLLKTRTFWVFICISLVIVGAIVNNLQHPAQAQYTQNDNNGQWTLTFNTNAGIAENNGVTVNGVSATATIPATSTGNILTSTIKPASFSKWNTLGIEGTWSNTSAVKVQLYTCDTIPALLPTNILSLTGQGDNAAGYTLVGGVLDISSLNTTSYPCLQVRVLLTSDSTSPAPVIRKVIASWSPLTIFLLNLTAPTTKQVGDKLTYTADYSVSYATDHDVIVWMPAPQPKSGTYTSSYGQNLTASFVSATNGGQFTSTTLTINGISIPANSVYWTLGTQAAGSTGSLSASFGTSSGTQNGVVYTTQAQIDSPRSDQVTSDASATTPGAQPVESVMTSQPYPSIIKSASGIMLDNDIHIYSGAPYNNTTTYTITVENSQTAALIGAETMFNTIVTDDLTDIFSKLSSSACGNVANPATRISLISNSGVLDSTAKTITWNLANMTPRSTLSTTFVVDYSGCADTTRITNNTTLKADNVAELTATKDVVIGVNPTPSGIYAKGDRTKVAGILPGINSGVDNNAPKSNDPTDLAGKTTYDGTTTYTLLTQNTSAVRLDKTVMMDMIPAGTSFISASIPVDVGATIYYFTGTSNTDPQVGPSFDVANLSNPGGGWTTTAPSTSSDVTWVAFYVPCLSSASIPAGGSCADKPSSAVGEITVKVLSPSATNPVSQTTCSVYDIQNFGLFTTYAGAASVSDQSDANVATFATPLSYVDNNELTHVVPKLASFKTSSNMSGPSQLDAGATGVYTIHYQNDGEATAKNATIDISIPTVDISGVPTPLDFVDFAGAPYTKTLDGNGKVTAIHVTVGDIPSGASRDFTLSLAAPRGANQNTNVTVTAVLSASDPDNCAPINQSLTASTTLKGAPILSVFKTRDESLIKATEDIHYQLAFTSTGDTPTSDTFIIDRVPAKTVFKQAYTNGTSLDANGNSYTCLNCKVYFSRGNPPLPANISAVQQLTPTQIYANFSLGIETSPGIWAPPASMATTDVVYVAYLLDNGALAKPQLASGTSGVVGMTVTNDNNGGAPGTAGSSVGTVIYNYAAIISNQTLQAIGNTVTTTILDDPGLIIDKTTPTSVVTADESFDWFITYKNDSSSNDTSAVITENLPYGVSLQDIYNTWNDLAISHGLSSGETTITSNPSVSMVTNVDGTTTVTITIAQALRTGDLLPQEGGTLRLRVKVNSGMGSGIRLNNKATACYSNQLAGPFCSDDESAVVVQNADLWLRKQVSNTSPLASESLTYSLVVANKGLHDAVNTSLTDTLPAGICFDSVNIVTPSGWSIGAPTISGGPCATAPTTLTWSVATGNALTNTSLAPGTIPGNSPDITLQYNVHVDNSIAPGTALTNGASVSTTTPEDSVYPNTDNKQVVTPLPDPYVHKTVSSPSVLPGGSFDYYIDYGNNSREAAQGVYVVDGLPDINGDGKTDITISAVLPNNGESVYYYDQNTNPALSTLGLSSSYSFSTDSRFKTSLSQYPAGEYPTHIIIVGSGSLASLEGPHRVLVQAQMIDPYTQAKLPAGSVVDNHVDIYSTTQDSNTSNNSADAITRVPAADLSISKTADPSGSYPGVTPGGTITYTVNFANVGASPICSVYIQEAYDSHLTNISNSFTTLSLTNSAGMPVLPLDPSGNTIGQPVNVTYDTVLHRWQLGSSDSVPYSNVCLPSGSHGSFTVTAIVLDSTADSTKITNTVTIGEDSPAIEDTLTNNTASVDTTVYRADLRLKKDGLSAGPDGIFGTADDSASVANPGETLQYKLSYNNIGNIDAKDASINEIVPSGTCFSTGSITDVPAGSTVVYSNDGGSTYMYTPVDYPDCNVTNFKVLLGDLPAPASLAAGQSAVSATTLNYFGNTSQVATSTVQHVSYAIKTDGSLWAWGAGSSGQIGNGTSGNTWEAVPVKVIGSDVTQFVQGSDPWVAIAFAVKSDGSLWAWGGVNDRGQVGNGTTVNQTTPAQIISSGVTKVVSSDGATTYAIKSDGSLWAWGGNWTGQIGNGTYSDQLSPVQVIASGVTQVVTESKGGSYRTVYAIKSDGSLWAWGDNQRGQVGNGLYTERTIPTQIMTSGVSQIAYSNGAISVVKSDGSLWAWGYNSSGQAGNGTTANQATPVQVISGGVTKVFTDGGSTTYAIKSDGSLWAWGANSSGQVGNGTTANQLTPTQIIPSGITDIAYKGGSVYAIKSDGSLWAWGNNASGQVGNGTTTNQLTPTQVIASGVTKITYSGGAVYVIKSDGSLWVWGSNGYGQVGNGTTANQLSPVQVIDSGVSQTVSVAETVFAIKSDGSLWGWGLNNSGQVGNSTATNQLSPVNVSGTGYTEYMPVSGIMYVPMNASSQPLAWKKLYLAAADSSNQSQIYNLYEADCVTPITGMQNLSLADSPIDISSLPATTTNYCLGVRYRNIINLTVTARMSFQSATDPSISFQTVVQPGISQTTIDNHASIATDTPEVTLANNNDNYQFRVPFADAVLTKDVDKASINLAAVAANTPLTYTLTLTNNGPNPIVNPTITDTLPNGLTYVSFSKASGPSTVNFSDMQNGQVVTLASFDTLAVGETVVLKLVATVNSGATIGSQFYNDAVVTSSTADTNLDNNADSATTTVGDLANVYIQKTAPVKAHINKDITYTITYGNNGNIAATNWSLTDPLDSNLDFVSATQTAGTPAVTCTNSGNTVTCTPDGGANLPAGATGTIQIVAHVHNDQTLADNTTVITNNAHIQTDTAQVTVSDDDSQATTTIWPGDLSGFGGRVFVDYNKDVLYTAGSDTPIKDVAVYASGYDTKNNIYGPAATDANYTAVMTSLLPILIANSIVPAGTTVADLSTLPNYVTVTPQKTLTDGTYAFSGLQPGTYYATEIQPVGYASTGSDAGYLSLDTNGLPVASPQDGQGSVESGNLAMVNNISTIVLGEGDFSAANNFGELPGTIGNFIWKDANGDGVYQTGEQPLSGIQVSLYNDVNKDGIYTSGVDTLVAMTATDVNGQYTFNGLSLDDGTGDAHYVVVVTDISGALAGYTNTTGTVGADNNSQKATGYAVVLSPTVTSNLTADFGYLRPVNIDLTKQIDGDGGGIYNTTEQITADQPFDYRVSVGNSALDTATGVEVVDTLPAGVTLLSVTTSAGSATPTTGLAPQVVWTVGTLTPNIRQTMTLHVVVKSADLATYRSNLTSAGTNRNVAQVTKQNEPDSNSTPNNMVSPFNITTHEDDEAYADTYMLAALGDYAWVDLNGNGIQDTGEPGLNGVTVELLDSSGAVIATTVTAANGAQNGYYTFGNLTVGMNYTVHFVTPTGYLLTQTGKGTAATGSDANPLDGKTAAVSLTTSEYNTSIDAGFVPLITLGNTIWSDTNNNGIKDNGEVGIGGVTVLLYEDSNGDNVLDPNVDTQVANTTTDANGVYTFANLLAGKYFVAIPSAQLTSGALAGYTMSPSMTTDPNDNVTGVNDGVFGTMFVTTAKPIILAYGSEPSGQGYVNTTLSFGFYKAAVPTNPSNPLANTGQSIIGIVIASVSIIGTAIALLFFGRRRTRDSKKG